MSKFGRNTLTANEIAALGEMFGPPPVLSSENKEGYYKLRNAFVAYYRPTDARHWAWIRELVDTQWEILRHLRYRTTAIELSNQNWIDERRKMIDKVLQEPRDEIRKLLAHCDNEIVRNRVASIKTYIAKVEAVLEKFAKPDDEKHCLALQREAKSGEKRDKLLKDATARRNNLLTILEYYCRPADQETEIPAAYYNALKQDEVKQITASPLVPAALVSGDLTTEDHPETVASAAV